jgi:hypothetical protein
VAFEDWGPLGGLFGTFEGDRGVDVSFHNDDGRVGQTRYREVATFRPFGPIDNGSQCLFGLDYRTTAWRIGEETPFHSEVGYWLWDAKEQQVLRCFMMPRGLALIAGGEARGDARTFRLSAELGSDTYGILSNRFLDDVARATRFDVSITIDDDGFSYDEVTLVEHGRTGGIVMHTDKNTLHRTSWEA